MEAVERGTGSTYRVVSVKPDITITPETPAQPREDAPPPPEATKQPPTLFTRLENLTAERIGVSGKEDAVLLIPPFGYRELPRDELASYALTPWLAAGLLARVDNVTEPRTYTYKDASSVTSTYAYGVVIFGVMSLGALGSISPTVRDFVGTWFWWIGAAILLTFLLAAWVPAVVGDSRARAVAAEITSGVSRAITLLLVLAFAIGLPAVVILYFGGVGRLFEWVPPSPMQITTLGRAFQGGFIAIAALLPALLYFMFRRQRLAALRTTFLREVLMLDGSLKTTAEADSKYGDQFREAFGSQRTLAFGGDFPVLVSTLLIAFGWMLTLLPFGDVNDDVLKLFSPRPEPFVYAFLGAYFFGLNLVFLRYVRADLSPKAYSHITVRILVALIVVWAVGVLAGSDTTGAAAGTPQTLSLGALTIGYAPLAFLIGVFPQTGLTLFAKRIGNLINFPFVERHPLTDLDGVNAYDQARLIEEGIDNVENLAHSDLIGLMLSTRIPTARLVDLVDQAILYVHLAADTDDLKRDRMRLRAYGIRSATNLLLAVTQHDGDDPLWAALDRPVRDTKSDDAAASGVPVVQRLLRIYSVLQYDDWLAYLRRWRRMSSREAQTIWRPGDLYRSDPPWPPQPGTPVPTMA